MSELPFRSTKSNRIFATPKPVLPFSGNLSLNSTLAALQLYTFFFVFWIWSFFVEDRGSVQNMGANGSKTLEDLPIISPEEVLWFVATLPHITVASAGFLNSFNKPRFVVGFLHCQFFFLAIRLSRSRSIARTTIAGSWWAPLSPIAPSFCAR